MYLPINKQIRRVGVVVVLLLVTPWLSAQDNTDGATKNIKAKKGRKAEPIAAEATSALQVDSPVYYVKTKASTEYYCNIIALAKGNSMTIKTYDGSTLFLQWDDIDTYKLTDYKAKSPELAAFKKAEDLRLKYDNWAYCYLTKSPGDTLLARIKKITDYSLTSNSYTDYPEIVVLDEQKGTAMPVSYTLYTGLEILSGDHYKFEICGDDDKEIYRILVDGPCKLLYREFRTDEGSMFTSRGPMGGTMPTGPQDREKYFLYMNHVLTKVRAESTDNIFMPTVSPNFKNKCKEIFKACPALVEKIENKTLRSNNLVEIVTEFNACIEHK